MQKRIAQIRVHKRRPIESIVVFKKILGSIRDKKVRYVLSYFMNSKILLLTEYYTT